MSKTVLSTCFSKNSAYGTFPPCAFFRWCISGYQCKRREAQTLVWLPQKQGQENRALAHVDQWITWFIKWLKIHILPSNLLAPILSLAVPDRTPTFVFLSPPTSSSLDFPHVGHSDLWHLFWEYISPQQTGLNCKYSKPYFCVQQHFNMYNQSLQEITINVSPQYLQGIAILQNSCNLSALKVLQGRFWHQYIIVNLMSIPCDSNERQLHQQRSAECIAAHSKPIQTKLALSTKITPHWKFKAVQRFLSSSKQSPCQLTTKMAKTNW